ncbi:hypothetical protein TCE0_044r16051 [Talaromyces pinophilus]|uniref:Transcription factor domain-containing protein n=1 Tax=Talaromyces pinophilus TaxID=128442 RepID=A0A478EAG4_TALPI|nr:hypothetical protein TCE0_044r16051 [Talaromyces pinophilus]
MAPITTPAFSSASLAGDGFTLGDLLPSRDTDGTQIDIDWGALGDVSAHASKINLPRLNEPIPKAPSHGQISFHNSDGRHSEDIPLNIDTWNSLQPPGFTSSALTLRGEDSSALSGRAQSYECSDSDFLARLPISEPVSRFIATSVIEMIRTYPLMMLRTENLPPFIHGHWYRPSGNARSSLPEPLINCMGIAQIFASHNIESKRYLWHLVKLEQQSFIELNEHRKLSRDDLLAAIQAQVMYIIMRIFDNSKTDQSMNLEMLVTHEILCESLVQLCKEPFCLDERLHPSPNWEDWVFAESKRRTALVWFLIAQTIHIQTGVSCDTISGFQQLPLCSPKSLWEARTYPRWQAEYDVYRSMSRNGLDVFGDLIQACKQSDTLPARLKLDTWNANTDNLGIALSLSATMMARD